MSLKDAIKKAAGELDHKRNDDWQEDGRPSLKRVQQLAKTTAITQDQLDDAVPDLRREQTKSNGATSTPEVAKPTPSTTSVAKAAPAKAKQSGKEDAFVTRIKEASGVGGKTEDAKPAKEQPFLTNTLMVALEPGYYGSKVRDPGETFYYTGRKGKWMDYADEEDRKRYAKEREDSAAGLDEHANDAQLGNVA